MLLDLSPEVQCKILAKLTERDVKVLSLCSRECYHITTPYLWITQRVEYGEIRGPPPKSMSYCLELYIDRNNTDLLELDENAIKKHIISALSMCDLKVLSLKLPYSTKAKDVFQNYLSDSISKMKDLQCLVILGANLSDFHAKKIAGLVHLRELDLSDNDLIGDKGVAYLSSLAQLEKLNLSETGITDKGLKSLAYKLKRLEELHLVGTKIRGRGLHLQDLCDKMVRLYLQDSKIEDESLKFFCHLDRLEYLDLSYCPRITDRGARYIQAACEIANLREIDIRYTRISTEGYEFIRSHNDVNVLYDDAIYVAMEDSGGESFSDDESDSNESDIDESDRFTDEEDEKEL